MHLDAWSSGLLLLALAPTPSASQRTNLCFTAHAKTALYCREPPVKNAPLDVYDDGETPQQARTLHYSKRGQLCPSKGKCKREPVLAVHILKSNADLPRMSALLFSAVCLVIPAAVFFLGNKKERPARAASSDTPATDGGRLARFAGWVLRFASHAWFPWVAAAGTAINLFTIIFTGATVVLFLGAVLGQPKRWRSTAIANAMGATAGSAVLLLLLRLQGVALLQEQFPTVLASPAWAKTTAIMQSYGLAGMVLVASLPLILHPVIAFGILSGASDATILGIVLCGRTLKYLTMAYLTAHAPSALGYFGIKQQLFEMARSATDSSANSSQPPANGPRVPAGWRPCEVVPGALVRVNK